MRYTFDAYLLDTACYELYHGGTRVPLRPKALEMLAYLVVHHDRVVSKQELLAQLWPNQVVGEDGLKAYIMAVRQALGERGAAPRLLRTVRGRGYRVVAPVTVEAPAEAPPPPAPLAVTPEVVEAPGRLAPPLAVPDPTSPGTVGPVVAEEYKRVSVLCCALPDALALAVRRDPEALYRLLQAVSQVVQEVLHHYEGTLTQQASEGWTAVFGMPAAQEDHARRAVLAALALHQRLRQHPVLRAPVAGTDLALQMGVHSGLVVVGALGQDTHRVATVVGPPVQLARRLQEQAAPGTLLLSAATYHLVQAEVRVTPGGTLAVDGWPIPMPVYSVEGFVGRHTGVAGRGPRARSPFVGRTRELALLHDRLVAVRAGEGQVVTLVGPPGMGKTRLLTEFGRHLAPDQVTWYGGHCLAYGQAIPYLPVRDLLGQLCALVEGDSAVARAAAVQHRLHRQGISAEEDVALLGQLLELPVAPELLAPLSPAARQTRTFALLGHLIRQEAQQRPLVLAVEDMHWIDPTSAAWLGSLVERLAGMAVLLLLTARPGYQPPWGTHARVTQLALPPLGTEESQAIVAAVPGTVQLSVPQCQQIIAHGTGNPFFVEELARHAVEHGGAATPVPETVHAVLAARIDRLPAAAKTLLQTAAVIGPEVPGPLLQAIAELPGDAVQQGLAHLQAAELLSEMRLVPEWTLIFQHVLTQEVAYGSLLLERRRVLHARIVEALEARAGDRVSEQVGRLAHHAVRGEVWDKAVTYCQQAAEKALARSAYREAVAAFEQALEGLQHLPESRAMCERAIDLRLAMDDALWRLGDWGRVLASLREAEALGERLGDQRRLAHISSEMADGFRILDDYERALRAGQRALTLAIALGDNALQVEANTQLGLIYYHRGDYGRAIETLKQTVTALACHSHRKRHDRPDAPAVWPWSWVLVCLSQVGAFDEGHAMSAEVLRLAEAMEHPFSLAVAAFGVGQLSLRQGDLSQAIAVFERGLAACQSHDLRDWLPDLAARVGYAYALAGRLPEALTLLEQASGQYAAMRGGAPHPPFMVWLGEAYLRASRLDEASTQAQSALASSRAHQERGNEAYALQLLGEVATQRHPPQGERAEAHYRQALTLAQELGMRPLVAHCHRGLGTLYATTGQAEQARTALSTAIEMYRGMEMTFWLPQTETALTQAER